MKKIDAIKALKTLTDYIEQNKCFEVFKPKNDKGKQERVIFYLNQLIDKNRGANEWASEKIQSEILNKGEASDDVVKLYKGTKETLEELTQLNLWVACLPYNTES